MRVIIAIAGLVVACGWAYSQSTHAFEVASIKQDPAPPPQVGVRGDDLRDDLTCDAGGRFVARRNNIQRLIMKAYNIQAFQVEGMPGWTRNNDAFYSVEAAAARPVSAEECRLMLQSLLADRFNFALRRQSKAIPVMALAVGKSGPKLTEGREGGPGARINGRPQRIAPDGTSTAAGWTMQQLAQALTLLGLQSFGLPVVDRTGLKGVYEFDLRYNEFPTYAGKSSDLPDMSAAVEEQLGLKLERRTEPFEVIVVDRIERPTAN